MFKSFRGFFSSDLAIDLGTANTLVYVRDKGIVLNEPSVVAIRHEPGSRNSRSILAVGQEAKKMLGRTPGNIQAIRPMKDGVIADFTVTGEMLKYFIRRVHETRMFQPSPRIIICVPCGSTQVERRAIRESAMSAGAREVYLIEEPIAAAIGAELPIAEPTGSMILDIGGGTTEVGVISLGGIVYSHSLRVAGDRMDESIIGYIRRKYGILIGEATAERVKNEIGTAWQDSEIKTMEIKGRHIADGVPRTLALDSKEIYTAISEDLADIVMAIKEALEQTPPELGADVAEKGLVITGGGTLLRDIDRMLAEQTGLPIIKTEDPLTCVVRGCGRALQEAENMGDVLLRE
ncbi:MAG: rod shape-determining protein [Gammaproteobacteria bacterium]|nr:MAG: rod shape-determining protein [Gammaproteobacteria bacterium]